MPNPINSVRTRFNAAIEWRVRDALVAHLPNSGAAMDTEVAVLVDEMKVLRSSIVEISSSLKDQIGALEEMADQLSRRVAALEQSV
jgi:hypothetical protein